MTLKYTIEKLKMQPLRIRERVREDGIKTLLGWGYYQYTWRKHERNLGIDTLEHAYGLNELGTNGGQYYDPIDYRCLGTILDYMDPNPQQDVFLDYGCGLGRAVIAAGMRPFKRAIGIENNEVLLDLCRKHVATVEKRKKFRCPVEIIAEDAADYIVPTDVTHILMYNPFVEQSLMNRVLGRIQDSLVERQRVIRLVYAPLLKHEHFLGECEFLRFKSDLPSGFWKHVKIMAYETKLGTIDPAV